MRIKLLQIIDFYIGNLLLIIHQPLLAVWTRLHSGTGVPESPRRVVVLKMLGGGSLLLAGPDLLALRRHYPEARFTLLATRPVAAFGVLLNFFDEIRIIDERGPFRLIWSALRILVHYRLHRPDLMIDLEVYSRLTAVFTFWIGASHRFGFYSNMAFLRKRIYTHLLFLNPIGGIYNFYHLLAETLQAPDVTPDEFSKWLAAGLPEQLPVTAASPYLAVAPFCSDLSRFREWRDDNWARFLSSFAAAHPGWTIYLVGGAENASAAAAIRDAAATPERIVNCCGRLALAESAKLIQDAELFVSIDSAPLHLARLLSRRVLSLWGATSPEILLREHSWLRETVIYARSICSPCVHMLDKMTCSPEANCMTAITPETVAAEAEKLLTGTAATRRTVEVKIDCPINLLA
ncbi:MAG: glycosyltransferase family 9 protein [Victivallales bacterium]|nr:glycosyltransferase family 9 protein [Victivallales bacterium]